MALAEELQDRSAGRETLLRQNDNTEKATGVSGRGYDRRDCWLLCGRDKMGVPREDAEKDDRVDLKVEKSCLTDRPLSAKIVSNIQNTPINSGYVFAKQPVEG